jgi:adenylosuccinate lyase
MIPRYTRPEMAKIWDPQTKFQIMLEVETLAAEAMELEGTIPKGVAQALRDRGAFDSVRIDEIDREVKHDVIAFLTNVGEYVGDEAKFMHQGMTSSDLLDTTFALQLSQSCDLLLAGLDRVCAALKKRALEHKHTICIGRSHGIHAEPTTFGIKLAGHYAAFARNKNRLQFARNDISVCAISGAVGTYATVSPTVEKYIADKLGLSVETVSTQVIPRDRHATFFALCGVVASSIENLAIEIRHLQRTEVREAEEFFSEKQKGSSAMPHKRNPVLSENLTGLSRLIRSHVTPALENVALWHERDISHSAVERISAPDVCLALDFALNRLAGLIENLLVYPDRMRANIERTGGLLFSQKCMLALTQKNVSREEAYRMVQAHAMKVWSSNGHLTLKDSLAQDGEISSYLSSQDLDHIFRLEDYVRHTDVLVERALAA